MERCPECGAVIPDGGPAGWCGPCLLKLGLEPSNAPAKTAGSTAPEETPLENPGLNWGLTTNGTKTSGKTFSELLLRLNWCIFTEFR